MSERDIVADLAFAQRQWASLGHSIEAFLCENAHAEILRLRAELAETRDKALEEAATAAEKFLTADVDGNEGEYWIAARIIREIRALKGPRDD